MRIYIGYDDNQFEVKYVNTAYKNGQEQKLYT